MLMSALFIELCEQFLFEVRGLLKRAFMRGYHDRSPVLQTQVPHYLRDRVKPRARG